MSSLIPPHPCLMIRRSVPERGGNGEGMDLLVVIKGIGLILLPAGNYILTSVISHLRVRIGDILMEKEISGTIFLMAEAGKMGVQSGNK
ncbi:hypothetical protein ACQEPW_001320 [Xanthomonas oryzae pv. oryzicola]|uniref:hypothetical protein n=1 Tax=Xanthomonas oryzae TaxID=347 RepID=UPI003D17B633